MPKIRYVEASKAHELFYGDVTASAVRNKLSDAELAAILANILGRMVGAAKPGVDKTTIEDTIVHNLQNGREAIPGLLAAIGKGH